MKRVLFIASLAVAASAANAGIVVTYQGAPFHIASYNGQPLTVTGPETTAQFASFGTDSAGTLTATFLGSEGADKDQFQFGADTPLIKTLALGSTVSLATGATSVIPFSFSGTSKFAYGTSLATNGTTFTSVLNAFGVLGTNVKTAYGTFEYVLGFNDKSSDRDYDDFVIGLNFTATPAVPEPSTNALMLAGLGAVGFLALRRKQDV